MKAKEVALLLDAVRLTKPNMFTISLMSRMSFFDTLKFCKWT